MNVKSLLLLSFVIIANSSNIFSQNKKLSYYEIKIYHLQNQEQEDQVNEYLKVALLPALHRNGNKNIGVFKPIGNDTAKNKRIYVLIPFKSAKHFADFEDKLANDEEYFIRGKEYLNAPYNKTPYRRIESVLIKAFPYMPKLEVPELKNEPSQRIYELRSYEGPTEKLYKNKVHMFNEGGEVGLFKRLGFNAVFYGSVLAGSRMPNLMYMTSFEDMQSRETHWKAFSADAEWKKLKDNSFYKNNVSKSEIILMHAADYSDI